MRVTFLGTGTSHGIPMIGCECPVCTSGNHLNTRTRSSVYVEVDGVSLLVDTTPELRIQALREGIRRVDAVLFTHCHADHIFGLDDVRRFNEMSAAHIPCYGSSDTLDTLRRAFRYVFVPTQIGGGKPLLELQEIRGDFEVQGVRITPVPVLHGRANVLGFRIGSFAYVTDVSFIPDHSMELLHGLDTLVLGALRPTPHETHFSIGQGLEVIEAVHPRRAYFTHIGHKLEHEATNAGLPPHVRLAHDGLKIEM